MAWLGNWAKRIKLTIDSGDVDAALSDFPILVYLSTSSGRNSDDVSAVFDELLLDANRKKIADTTSDGQTQCFVEIERWDDATEKAWLWVKVPAVASGIDTILYLYYDADHADNTDYVGDTNSTPAENVWDANFKAVYHMKDGVSNAATYDSTGNNNDGGKAGANEPNEVEGEISKAQDFDGNNDEIDCGADASLELSPGNFTLEVLAYPHTRPAGGTSPTILDTLLNKGYQIGFHGNSNKWQFSMRKDAGTLSQINSNAAPALNTLNRLVALNDGTMKMYINKVLQTDTAVPTDTFEKGMNPFLGKDRWNDNFDGLLDEVRISDTDRSVAWLRATDESNLDDLLAFGEEEIPQGVLINGTEVLIEKGSIVVENRIEERSIANFTVVDLAGTASYSKGQAILIYDPNDVLIFGGVIDNPETVRAAPSGELLHPITCVDYHYFADKRLVAESYESKTCGFIVDDIFDKYLDAEGVTIGNIDPGATLVEAIFNYVRVTDAYDALAEKAGFVWFIDENKALYFQARNTTAAPWTLTGADIVKGSGRLSGANPKYRNRQYIRGGKGTTAVRTETFTGDGVNVAFTVGYPIVKVPTVTVNAVGQTVGIKGIDTARDCYWSKGDPVVVFDAGSIPGAVAVVIVYQGEYDVLALAEDPAEIAALQAVEGSGTGYVEDIADEPTLTDTDALLDSGEAKLAKFGVSGQRFMFQTVRTGLKPGQLQTVNYPVLSLSADMLIEAVTTRVYTGNLLYNVTVIEGPESGSWAELFKVLAHMKQEVIDRLNVGTEQILIILVLRSETWQIEEDINVTVLTCTACNSVPCGGATPIVC